MSHRFQSIVFVRGATAGAPGSIGTEVVADLARGPGKRIMYEDEASVHNHTGHPSAVDFGLRPQL